VRNGRSWLVVAVLSSVLPGPLRWGVPRPEPGSVERVVASAIATTARPARTPTVSPSRPPQYRWFEREEGEQPACCDRVTGVDAGRREPGYRVQGPPGAKRGVQRVGAAVEQPDRDRLLVDDQARTEVIGVTPVVSACEASSTTTAATPATRRWVGGGWNIAIVAIVAR
jgi:hypothetical protein